MVTTKTNCPECGKEITVEAKVHSVARGTDIIHPILRVEFSTFRTVHYCEERT